MIGDEELEGHMDTGSNYSDDLADHNEMISVDSVGVGDVSYIPYHFSLYGPNTSSP